MRQFFEDVDEEKPNLGAYLGKTVPLAFDKKIRLLYLSLEKLLTM